MDRRDAGRRAAVRSGDRRHRRAVGARHRQRRLRPGSRARARPRGAADLRRAHAAHGRSPAVHAGLAGVSLDVRIDARVGARAGPRRRRVPVHASRLQRSGRARRVARGGAQSQWPGPSAAGVRVCSGRRWTPPPGAPVLAEARGLVGTAVARHLPQRLAEALVREAGSPGRSHLRAAAARRADAPAARAHRVRAAVDRRRRLPDRRGHRRRRGARRGAPRHAREPARARSASSAARCSTPSGRSAATTSAGRGPPDARPGGPPGLN